MATPLLSLHLVACTFSLVSKLANNGACAPVLEDLEGKDGPKTGRLQKAGRGGARCGMDVVEWRGGLGWAGVRWAGLGWG